MDYVVVGAGSLGQSFAALLARAGQRVTLLATPRSEFRLRTSGEIRLYGAVDARVPVGVGGLLAACPNACSGRPVPSSPPAFRRRRATISNVCCGPKRATPPAFLVSQSWLA